VLQHIVRDNSPLMAEAGGAECLPGKGAVTDFAAFAEEDGALEFVRGLALVGACLAAPAQGRARIPLDHEQRTFEPAEFPQRLGKLAWIWRARAAAVSSTAGMTSSLSSFAS